MSLEERFQSAQAQVQTLSRRPSNDTLLQLYALYKQGSVGDVQGRRPGLLDVKGRAKFDAWARQRGKSIEESQEAYIHLVESLIAAD